MMNYRLIEGGSAAKNQRVVPFSIEGCEHCGKPNQPTMYDARTHGGGWGWLCPTCFGMIGVGLGIGCGQKYELTEDND